MTSPPYWALRDYGVDGQIGLGASVAEYVEQLVAVFREVRRVLRPDGTLWLNLGDAHAGNGVGYRSGIVPGEGGDQHGARDRDGNGTPLGLKPKDLIGLPWRVAFALQADGWWLRSEIIWHKPNCQPDRWRDRPTRAHEHLFLFAKNSRYHFDAAAIDEPAVSFGRQHVTDVPPPKVRALVESGHHKPGGNLSLNYERKRRNVRSVWTIPTQPFSSAKFGLDVDHFATFPPKLVEPCIKAGCPIGGTVLDCFGGAGTTGLVAERLQRRGVLIELNPTYREMAAERIRRDAPLLALGDAA